MRGAAAVIAALVVALAVAGTASAAPTKREFIRKGDALCAGVARQLAPIQRRAEAAKSLPEAQQWRVATEVWSAQIAIQRRFNERLRAVGSPAGDAAARRLVADVGRGLVLAVRVRDAFARRSRPALADALRAYVTFSVALNRRVRAYGFRVCGRS